MAMGFLKGAFGAAKGAATSDGAKKAGVGALTAIGALAGEQAKETYKARRKRSADEHESAVSDAEAQAMAIAMARNLRGGKYSDRTPIAGQYRYAVFVGAEPRGVF